VVEADPGHDGANWIQSEALLHPWTRRNPIQRWGFEVHPPSQARVMLKRMDVIEHVFHVHLAYIANELPAHSHFASEVL
jgi:hypothetical protein